MTGELEIAAEGATLAAKISLPAGPLPAPALVAVHGADAGSRELFPYEHLHKVLPPAGIAAVTFDRRGEGRSTGEPSRGQFRRQADDALAVIEHVGHLPGVSPRRIGLWGISQGGWVAPLAATLSPRVAFLVLVASVGVTPGAQMQWAAQFQAGRAHGQEAGKRAARVWALVLDWMRGGDREPLETAVAEAKTQPWWPQVLLDDKVPPDDERLEIEQELDFDPEPVFREVRVPVLLVYGDQDEWIPIEESIAVWRRARPDADVLVVPNVGHVPAVDDQMSPLYEQTMLQWLHRQVA
jgi:pimeloyl-ACP methyl ester carboxylesterase